MKRHTKSEQPGNNTLSSSLTSRLTASGTGISSNLPHVSPAPAFLKRNGVLYRGTKNIISVNETGPDGFKANFVRYSGYNQNMKLTCIRGLPSAGKSTYAKKHYDCLILENDMFCYTDGKYEWSPDRLKAGISLVEHMTRRALESGSDVCLANTFTKRRFLEFYRNIAAEYGAEFEVIRLETAWPGNKHSVPDNVLTNMREHFDDWTGEKIIKSGERGT